MKFVATSDEEWSGADKNFKLLFKMGENSDTWSGVEKTLTDHSDITSETEVDLEASGDGSTFAGTITFTVVDNGSGGSRPAGVSDLDWSVFEVTNQLRDDPSSYVATLENTL